MAEYRLVVEDGEVLETRTLDTDSDAVAWRSAHPFEAPDASEGDSRQLHIERQTDDGWVRLDGLGTAEMD